MPTESQNTPPRGTGLKKLFAALAFLAGGVMAELASPQHCIQIHVNRQDAQRRRRSRDSRLS